MPNTILTPSIIAKEAAMRLSNELVMANRVYRGLDSEFRNVGDTISVRKPATFVANDFVANGQVVQNITESSVAVKLDKWQDVEMIVTSKELTLDIKDFGDRVMPSAISALAQKIDADLCALANEVPYRYGTAASTPDGLDDLAGVKQIMRGNKVPFDGNVSLIMDEVAEAKFLQLDALVGAYKSGSTEMLRSGALGQVYGFDLAVDQNIVSHTAGAGTVKVDLVAGYEAGTKTIHVDGVTTALKVGDLVTIKDKPYVLAAVGSLATADQDITLDRGLEDAVVNDDDVTVVASHTKNIAFHKNAFVLATAKLEPPMGGANFAYEEYNGVAVRVVMDWTNSTRNNTVLLDVLYGVKCVQPELACVLLG